MDFHGRKPAAARKGGKIPKTKEHGEVMMRRKTLEYISCNTQKESCGGNFLCYLLERNTHFFLLELRGHRTTGVAHVMTMNSEPY